MKNHKKQQHRHVIIEKELGIPADYQYNALRNSHFLQSNWHANKLTALETVLSLTKDTAVFDLGSGSGNFELAYARNLKSITALDYHQEALDFLQKQLKKAKITNVKLINGDIRELQKVKKVGKFDLIIMIDVIEHIDRKEATAMVNHLKTFLKPHGLVCVVTPNYKSLWLHIESILDRFTIVPHFGGHQHLAQYYPANLTSLFKRNGYKVKRICTFNLLSFLLPNKILSGFVTKLELKSSMKFGNLLLGIFQYEGK